MKNAQSLPPLKHNHFKPSCRIIVNGHLKKKFFQSDLTQVFLVYISILSLTSVCPSIHLCSCLSTYRYVFSNLQLLLKLWTSIEKDGYIFHRGPQPQEFTRKTLQEVEKLDVQLLLCYREWIVFLGEKCSFEKTNQHSILSLINTLVVELPYVISIRVRL